MSLSKAALAVLKSKSFWVLYYDLEDDERDEEDILDDARSLGSSFEVTFDKDDEGVETATILFPFDCGPRYELVIEYMLDSLGAMVNLDLKDRSSGDRRQMGWRDLAGWHPYCLRIEEFDALTAYWAVGDPRSRLWQGARPQLEEALLRSETRDDR
jgi:hypothetical protein